MRIEEKNDALSTRVAENFERSVRDTFGPSGVELLAVTLGVLCARYGCDVDEACSLVRLSTLRAAAYYMPQA